LTPKLTTMPNQTEIECYFRSSDLEKLCKKGKDIIVNFKATYLPGKPPEFEISASVLRKSDKITTVKGMLKGDDGSGTTDGCPSPCPK
jgi:hypothetical protein